ncbi:MAG: hypothetical protein LBV77_06930 [Candidatus Adiutrix intracellularis]|jgi:hypothetical protein|nr:hypothetical protein [Candidatus Adiutrix intracellularis]
MNLFCFGSAGLLAVNGVGWCFDDNPVVSLAFGSSNGTLIAIYEVAILLPVEA